MVRLYRYILLVLAATLATACSNETFDEPTSVKKNEVTEDGRVNIRFSVAVPDNVGEKAVTKAMGDGDNGDQMTDAYRNSLDLWLFIYDEQGIFVEGRQAIPVTGKTDQANTTYGDRETKFDVSLKPSKAPMHIHFIANYSGSAALAESFGSEVSMMTALYVTGNADTYWHRLSVAKIDEETLFERVPLVRNFAKVTVTNTATNFTFEGFYLCNIPDRGSVVPYNDNIGGFQTFFKQEPRKAYSYDELLAANYKGFLASGMTYVNTNVDNLPATAFTTTAKYLYETPNGEGTTKGQTFMIVKGRYQNNASSYYKVDFVMKGKYGSEYYNILRNINYSMEIQKVSVNGYATPLEAYNHPASNNLSASITTEAITNMTDEAQQLFVSDSYFCFTEGGENLEIWFKYQGPYGVFRSQRTANYSTSNFIRVYATGDTEDMFASEPTIEAGSAIDDWFKVKLNLKNPGVEPKTVNLRLYVDQEVARAYEGASDTEQHYTIDDVLSRDLTLVLRQEYPLYLDCPLSVEGGNGSTLTVKMLVPTVNERLFPLTFYIEPDSKSIYPDANHTEQVLAVRTAPSIIEGKNEKSFQYEKILTWEEYNAITETKTIDGAIFKVVPLYFKTNASVSETWVYAQGTYFRKAKDQFSNSAPVFDEEYASRVLTTEQLGTQQVDTILYKTTNGTEPVTIKVHVTEGGVEMPTQTITIPAADRGQVHAFYYQTTSFSSNDIEVWIENDDGTQIITPTVTHRMRHLLTIPANTFAPILVQRDERDARLGGGTPGDDYEVLDWVYEEPSVYITLKDYQNEEADNKVTFDKQEDVYVVVIPDGWYRASWLRMTADGIGDQFVLDADRARSQLTGRMGIDLTEDMYLRFVGYNSDKRISETIKISDLVNAILNGTNEDLPLYFEDWQSYLETTQP
ncbi:MAG: hypothetical protein J6U14_09305 [Bacteroidaceae bacterium]|nr:hypothetical protein [Bacteroidaceae bacterium]